MGLFNISFFLGMGSGPFIGGVLYDKFGMNAVFEAMAVLTGFAFLLTLIALPDIKPTTAKVKDKAKQKQFSFKALLANDLLIGLLIYRFINALGRGGVMSFVPVLAEKIHITPGQVGIIISANVFFMAVLQGLFGYLSDRYNKFYLVLIGAIIATVGLALIPLAHTFWSLMILALVMGLGGAISMPAATAINVKIGQHHGMGASMGLFNMAMSVGMILAPLISGGVMDLWGVKYIFYVAGGISAVGILFFFYFVRRGLKQEGSHKYL
jgi:MFS family permease